MRLLIDANLSPRVAAQLADAGFDAIHVADVGLLTAADEAILEYASARQLVIVSADTDFGELLAASPGRARPSVVLLATFFHDLRRHVPIRSLASTVSLPRRRRDDL